MKNIAKQNEPLVTHIYTADPSAHVFEGKIYIYPSHDLDQVQISNDNGDQYNMEDYHILSLDDTNSPCIDNGEALHLKTFHGQVNNYGLQMLLIRMELITCFSQQEIKKISLDLE